MTDVTRIALALIQAAELRESSYTEIGPRTRVPEEKIELFGVTGRGVRPGAVQPRYSQQGYYAMGWHEAACAALGLENSEAGHRDVLLVVILAEAQEAGICFLSPLRWAKSAVVD